MPTYHTQCTLILTHMGVLHNLSSSPSEAVVIFLVRLKRCKIRFQKREFKKKIADSQTLVRATEVFLFVSESIETVAINHYLRQLNSWSCLVQIALRFKEIYGKSARCLLSSFHKAKRRKTFIKFSFNLQNIDVSGPAIKCQKCSEIKMQKLEPLQTR